MVRGKRYPNRLGLKGWAVGARWGFERYLYTLHRATGIGLLVYFLIHIGVTSTRVWGPEAWREAMVVFAESWIGYGEVLVFLAFAFHACNGIRLVMIEMGWAVGPAEEPIYPYKSSLNVQRPLTVVLMLLMVVFILGGLYDYFFLAAH